MMLHSQFIYKCIFVFNLFLYVITEASVDYYYKIDNNPKILTRGGRVKPCKDQRIILHGITDDSPKCRQKRVRWGGTIVIRSKLLSHPA